MLNRFLIALLAIAVFALCAYIGMNCGPSTQDISAFMQTDAYRSQKSAYEKRTNF